MCLHLRRTDIPSWLDTEAVGAEGGVSAAEKGHRDLAASPPPSSQGLSSLVAHLDPGRSLQAAPCFCSPFPCSSPSDATKLA